MNKVYPSRFLLSLLLLTGFAPAVWANIYPFNNVYTAAAGATTTGTGRIVGTYNDVTNQIAYSIVFSGLVAPTSSSINPPAHFHGPATPTQNAGVVLGHVGFPQGVTAGYYSNTQTLTEVQEGQLLSGLWYSNIHTTAYPGGEIRTQIIMGDPATTSPFRNTYTAAAGVTSPGTGMIIGTYNQQTNQIAYSIVFSGLVAPTSSSINPPAHFHGPATPTQNAGVVLGHVGFPQGVTAGYYSNTQTLTEVQEGQLLSGLWYSNIHTTAYPGGEIRTQITLTDILPPTISNVVVSTASLWPANHKMREVAVSYTSTDNFPAPVSCALSVSSNEPVTSASDVTSPDWMVVSSQQVQLRAERLGGGNGRIYTITVTCTDAQGNAASRTATVVVPHDRSANTVASADRAVPESGALPLSVAPNPARSYFRISTGAAGADARTELRLYDVSGRLVESRSDVKGDVEMGHHLKAGTYLLQMTRCGESRLQRLVKLD